MMGALGSVGEMLRATLGASRLNFKKKNIYLFSNINETIEIHKGMIGTTSNIGEVGGCGVTLGKH